MGSDPVKYRQQYGKDVRMMGDLANAFGRQLQGDRTECSARPLIEKVDYRFFCVTWCAKRAIRNYLYFTKLIRASGSRGKPGRTSSGLPISNKEG